VRRADAALARLVSGPVGRVSAVAIEIAAALANAARERLRASRSA
jgi:hypothetical protein